MESRNWPVGLNENPINRKALDDIRNLGSRSGGNLLEKIVGMFLERSESLLEEIKQHLANDDAEQLWNSAHSLKSSSGNVGAMNVFDLCAVIESRGREGQLDGLEELIELLEQELRNAAKELDNYLIEFKDK